MREEESFLKTKWKALQLVKKLKIFLTK